MRSLLLICFLFFCSLSKAQYAEETKSFLDYIRQTVFKVDTLFYTEDLNERTIPVMRRYLLKDTIWIYKQLEHSKLKRIDSLVLSEQEKAYIETQINNQTGKIWGENLLKKSRLTGRDTTYKKETHFSIQKHNQSKTIYSFSKPIFLREASICFFYYQHIKRGSGEGQLGLYKKEGDTWKFIQWFYAWGGGGS